MSKIIRAISNMLLDILTDEEEVAVDLSTDFEIAWQESINQFEHTVFDEDSLMYKMCKKFYFMARMKEALISKHSMYKLKRYLRKQGLDV